jgi:hypothetical protein
LDAIKEISGQLTRLSDQVAHLGSDIHDELVRNEWNARMAPTIRVAVTIGNIQKDLQFLADSDFSVNQDEFKADIVGRIRDQIIDQAEILHKEITGSGGRTPILTQWSKVVSTEHNVFTADDQAKIFAMYTYFDWFQATATSLVSQYYLALDPPVLQRAEDVREEYLPRHRQQRQGLPDLLPEDRVLFGGESLMLMRPVTDWGDCSAVFAGCAHLFSGTTVEVNDQVRRFTTQAPWRLPTNAELAGLFDGWQGEGLSPYAAVRALGIPASMSQVQGPPTASRSVNGVTIGGWVTFVGARIFTKSSQVFDTSTGTTSGASGIVALLPVLPCTGQCFERYGYHPGS